jgi:hypothetical protein
MTTVSEPEVVVAVLVVVSLAAIADVVTIVASVVLAKSILNMINSSLHRKVPAGLNRV